MNKIETKIIILGFVVLFTFFYLKPFYNSQVNGLLESDLQPTPFSLNSNDSSEIKIFFLSYQIGIGTTWNVTFIVDSSSTSSISGYFSYLYSTSHPEYWEGQKQFTVSPGSIFTQLYISHYEGDNILRPEILVNLSSSTGQASGSYFTNITSIGFFINMGTVYTYISNITDWSLSYYSTSPSNSIPSFTTIISISIFICLILCLILLRKRSKRVNSK